MYDVIIAGGGPAGLAAALTLGRMLRRTLVLDSGDYRNAPAAALHNFLGHDGTPPAELRRIARAQLTPYETVEVRDLAATAARPAGDGFELTLSDGSTVRTKRVLLATGVVDELPPIEGLAELWGTSVFHCPYCHGFEVRGKALAVLGSEPRFADLAIHLTRLTDDVALCSNGPLDLPAEVRAALTDAGVQVREQKVTRVRADRLEFESGDDLPREAVFTGGPLRQRSDLAAQLGCRTLEDGAVEVDPLGRTTVPGVHAAGDMARAADAMPAGAIAPAAYTGAVSAAIIDKELHWTEHGLPSMLPEAPRA
jgi:thioredoxin reductase